MRTCSIPDELREQIESRVETATKGEVARWLDALKIAPWVQQTTDTPLPTDTPQSLPESISSASGASQIDFEALSGRVSPKRELDSPCAWLRRLIRRAPSRTASPPACPAGGRRLS